MKRLWLGIGLLAFLLVFGILMGNVLEKACGPIGKDLDKAADAARAENWDLAAAHLGRAEKSWRSRQNGTAALTHHDPLEEIELYFSRLHVYCQTRSGPDFRAGCSELSRKLQNLFQNHDFAWWNLL